MLTFLKSSPKSPKVTKASEKQPEAAVTPDSTVPEPLETRSAHTEVSLHSSQTDIPAASASTPLSPKDTPLPDSPLLSPTVLDSPNTSPYGKQSSPDARRFSFRSFTFLSNRTNEHKPALSTEQEHDKKVRASAAHAKRIARPAFSNSDKRAKQSALIVRSLIVGAAAPAPPKTTKAVTKPEISRVKSQLMQRKSANKVIAHLRALPITDQSTAFNSKGVDEEERDNDGPIHAVCLDATDAEAHERHFSRLTKDATADDTTHCDFPSVITASISSLSMVIQDMHLVSLITSPGLGIGQPGDGEGLLAGSLPTAETVLNGIQQITPQLMALGFATGKAVLPDHTGVYPPKDRISVLTYWWGLEVVLPPTTLSYLDSAKSVSGAVINFLTALSVINNGVREVLPFVRYIGQFIDFEFDSIKKENKGHGVVCAATWIMPAAMVPRAWDFPPPPPPKVVVHDEDKTEGDVSAPVKPSTEIPRPSSAYSDESSGIVDHSNPIAAMPPVLPELVVSSPPSEDGQEEAHDEPSSNQLPEQEAA
ncbi:hypothetical protein SERLA73DRAFT_160225 [Serpula lacrymans var. lacrymans S7.3]|uniref:Uncharacterized protein n=2 Tax=Serpula lacrymans var. lacrymans TaxID=341189 RepID=F8PWH2_SERL3|nr:uncharacterized protein SERLADRAFT_415258 [Serpula lacrymans var. lacrymans S7.9]EGO00296.1 hypothetical protein SERLA73DRAFT_160225 [Serpula lacrymans var. lacrymans S7.3]EGO25856.1 hypothetical protein SERLADRAFT_415258 [Serpula lacrymans var. lacrymans S7.9]